MVIQISTNQLTTLTVADILLEVTGKLPYFVQVNVVHNSNINSIGLIRWKPSARTGWKYSLFLPFNSHELTHR